MKALILPSKTTAELLRILREHFINESTNVFMANVANLTRVDLISSTQLQAQLQFQISKIMLDNVYRYLKENRLHEFVAHRAYNQFGMAMYINPVYATEILKPFYEQYFADDDLQEVENDLVEMFRSRINYLYSIDSERFNAVFYDIMEMYMQVMPNNIHVLRFEFTPSLATMVCYSQPEQVMQPLYA